MATLRFGLCSLLLACVCAAGQAAEHPLVVVGGPGIGADKHLTRETIALMFRRKQTLWPNGQRVQAVNLPVQHPLRRWFSATVLGQTPEQMEDYWREMYFNGVLPPHVVASEAAVELFVAGTPGAIGYLSCVPPHGVTVLMSWGEPAPCPAHTAD